MDQSNSSGQKIRLHVNALEVGMFVCELDRPWMESPFLLQGFELQSEDDVKAVQECCSFVYIDISKAKRNLADSRSAATDWSKQPRTPFDSEIGMAQNVYRKTHSLVKNLLDDIRFGNAIDTKAAKTIVSDCVESVIRNPSALTLLTQLKNKDEYTSQHSLNVCILSVLFGQQMHQSPVELENIGLCGLLHDMGKMKVPLKILNKEGQLEGEEFEIMKNHTTHGRDILMSARNIFPGAVDVAYSHHEKIDGSGYPRGIDGSGITTFARMVSIVDAYDAITSDRVYQQGRSHLEAINILTKSRNSHFDGNLVMQFIACIGIYPPGSLVEMTNGEVGIVTEVPHQNKTQPKVILILDKSKSVSNQRMIDLRHSEIDRQNKLYKIKEVIKDGTYCVRLQDYLDRGLIIKKSAA